MSSKNEWTSLTDAVWWAAYGLASVMAGGFTLLGFGPWALVGTGIICFFVSGIYFRKALNEGRG